MVDRTMRSKPNDSTSCNLGDWSRVVGSLRSTNMAQSFSPADRYDGRDFPVFVVTTDELAAGQLEHLVSRELVFQR